MERLDLGLKLGVFCLFLIVSVGCFEELLRHEGFLLFVTGKLLLVVSF
jgi:hypothetical protein